MSAELFFIGLSKLSSCDRVKREGRYSAPKKGSPRVLSVERVATRLEAKSASPRRMEPEGDIGADGRKNAVQILRNGERCRQGIAKII